MPRLDGVDRSSRPDATTCDVRGSGTLRCHNDWMMAHHGIEYGITAAYVEGVNVLYGTFIGRHVAAE